MSVDALTPAMTRCKSLLQSVGETFWSQKIERFLSVRTRELSADDAREVMTWFGGMGSFNDLMISAVNDHDVKPEDEGRYNRDLDHLRDMIYSEAKGML
jgi:Domain of unknown function (DUF6966)